MLSTGRSRGTFRIVRKARSPGLLSRRVTSLEVDDSRTSTCHASRNPSHPFRKLWCRDSGKSRLEPAHSSYSE
ncbi:hypothetical protein MDS_1395 [Ectopseudomonas mendocina NK-01]|nr:hypothetical protein MDS_1395 [Pseudomonas mendocina NK-01]